MKGALIQWLIPLIVAPLTVALGKLVLSAKLGMDNLPAWAKQSAVVFIAAVLVGLEGVLGAQFCPAEVACSLDNFDQKALVSALLAFALHAGLKKDGAR